MRIYRRLPIIQSGIAARCRKLWLIAASTLASAFLGVSEPALAQTFDFGPGGPLPPAAPAPGNPYPSGINVNTNSTTPLNLTLQPGVNVTIPAGPLNVVGVNAANGSGPVNIIADRVTITNITNPSGNNQVGLSIARSIGDAMIMATNTTINVSGTASDHGIAAFTQPFALGQASVIWSGPSVTASGQNTAGIQAGNRGIGDASIDASGNISGKLGTATGFTFLGLDAVAGDTTGGGEGGAGNSSVMYHSGTIDVQGNGSAGIFAAANVGSATITTLSGTTIMVSREFLTDTLQPGVDAFSTNGNATATVASTILINGNPAVPTTNYKSNPTGIRASTDLSGDASVTYTGPGITVHGGGGLGIVAVTGSSDATTASGRVTVDASGPIVADGSNAVGILADSGFIRNVFSSGGRAPTTITGPVNVTASNVSALGQFGTAISATGGSGGVSVNILPGGSVMGGWQADLTSVGSTYGLPAAGVVLGSAGGGTATLTNNGSIGALSDRAVASPLPSFFANPTSSFPTTFPTSNNTSIINNGTITGFVQLVGDNNSFVNNGLFNLRHFADTTGAVDASGNGVRDTVRVAIADLGPGVFTNNGTLALPAVTGATTLDPTGQYLPLNNPNNAMALGGPLQGHLIGVTTFTNSGIIDLQSNPAAGDVLVITGSRTAGVAGPGTFITGGTLKLDTVLNQGGAATRSDTLVVDGTQVSPNGATSMAIRNAGGTGALTVGDGILVVQVLDPARSADGAFKLANQELRAGEFDYDLFHGGIGGSNPGDWFLRNEFVVGPPVVPPVVPPGDSTPPPPVVPPPETGLPPNPPQRPLPPGVYPIIGPEIATYGVVQPLARQLGLAILGTLDDRVGDTYEPTPAPTETIPSGISKEGGKEVVAPPPPVAAAPRVWPSVWSRFFAQSVDTHYRAFADPSASGSLWGFQWGVDLLRGSLIAGHYERAGLYGAFGHVNSDVHGLVTNPAATAYSLGRTGSVNLNAWSAGGYWTHVGPGGWYLDGVLQGTYYSGSASTQFASLNTDGTGFIASLEGGAPFCWPLLGPGFVIEPQGQILWQKVTFYDKNDGLGDVALGDTTGPSGRIGLRTKWTIATAGGQVWQPYLRANLWRDWGANANTVFSGKDVAPLESQANVVELGGGLTVGINANVSVYANADYEFAVGGTDDNERNGVRGAFGVRYTW